MADVNEEILAMYLKRIKKWFYIEDITFSVPQNYSNIDLLGYDPVENVYYDFEVKYRSAYILPLTEINYLVNQFVQYRKQREAKINEYILPEATIKKVIVTTRTMLGGAEHTRIQKENRFHQLMHAEGYDSEIWYFDNMIPELNESININGRYNTQLEQIIRMMKTYDPHFV